MCRLFGMHSGQTAVSVKYWLTQAPDSMAAEGQRNPDGAGIGWFDAERRPHVVKQAGALDEDSDVLRHAVDIHARTVVSHVRDATAGQDTKANTHPFEIEATLMAHNGGFGDLAKVDAELGDYRRLVTGDTDSERYAALIVKEAENHGGDIGLGILAAAQWLARHVPMYSLNTVVIRDGWLWALRYPDERALHLARRVVTPSTGAPDAGWSGSSAVAAHQVLSDRETPIVVVASERIDDADDWWMLQPGELITVDPNLTITSRLGLTSPPRHLVALNEADPNKENF